jgi:hypothetical protein
MGLTLREGDREYFYDALDKYFPGLRKQYHQKYGYAYEVTSDRNRELMSLVRATCKEHDMLLGPDACFSYLREFPEKYEQLSLF